MVGVGSCFKKVHSLWPFHPISVDTKVDERQMEMEELSSAFPDFRLDEDEEDEDDENDEDDEAVDCRILFQGRDLELEPFGVRIESGRVRGSK